MSKGNWDSKHDDLSKTRVWDDDEDGLTVWTAKVLDYAESADAVSF
ncbi:hypothetical protein [Paenibacillus humicola]|nr:hypothetical protein [Paenibacillus humicola]